MVNCAAVRRFTRVNNKNDTDDENIFKSKNRVVVHVGGVIGQQQNRSDDRWSVSKVVNCGSVFNSRSANVGGVIAYWLDYGGTVQKCFNFGKMTTNTNDHDQQLGGYGAVGGIVGFIDQLFPAAPQMCFPAVTTVKSGMNQTARMTARALSVKSR